MSKQKKEKSCETVTPEQVIVSRLRRLADQEEITSFIVKLIWMAALMVLIFGVLFGVTPMKNNDMSPKISSGDLLLYYRLENKFRTQDVIVFEKNNVPYVGRIIAKSGDTVEITEDSQLRVNNSTVYESDIFYSTPRYGDEISYPLNLGENEYFILCDYRNGAKDSRYFGAVDQDEIKGKVITVIRRSNL
jgi:signal peptidase I